MHLANTRLAAAVSPHRISAFITHYICISHDKYRYSLLIIYVLPMNMFMIHYLLITHYIFITHKCVNHLLPAFTE